MGNSSGMENTSLRLLALDGLFTVTFTPSLSPVQYAELVEVVTRGNLPKKSFCEQFAALALAWGVEFSSDGHCDE
jgi:hypothetical protein